MQFLEGEFGYQSMKEHFKEGGGGASVIGEGCCSLLVGYPGPSKNYVRT